MKVSFVAILATLSVGNAAYPMDGVFDREAEVQKYLTIITTKTNVEVTNAAKEIYSSGISDERLAKAVNYRLYSGYQDLTLKKSVTSLDPAAAFSLPSVDDQYGIWMCRALSSFGNSEYASTFNQMKRRSSQGGVKSDKVRMAADNEVERIEWHKRKNEIMASRQFHQPGDDQHASQMLNLLVADDPTYRHFALDRISAEKLQDPRIYKMLEDQIAHHIDSPDSEQTRRENNFIVVNIKLLGLSGDTRYRAILEKVLASNAVPGVKKRAEVALNQLK